MMGYQYTYLDSRTMLEEYLTLDLNNTSDIIGVIFGFFIPVICIFIVFPFIQKYLNTKKDLREKLHKKKLLEQILIQKELEEEIEKQVHLEEEK